jgi:hypothetical protein
MGVRLEDLSTDGGEAGGDDDRDVLEGRAEGRVAAGKRCQYPSVEGSRHHPSHLQMMVFFQFKITPLYLPTYCSM